jgi:hypothetical protein
VSGWCVAFKEIEAHLNSLGYFEVGRVEYHEWKVEFGPIVSQFEI